MTQTTKTAAPDTLIFVETKKLSDGSYVHDVHLGEHVWHATSKAAADDLAHAIAEAINEFTVDMAGVIGAD